MPAVVNQDRCAGCGACIEACPVQAISLNLKRKAHINRDKCMECGRCARVCPKQAIELVQEAAYPLVQRDAPQTIATAINVRRTTVLVQNFARDSALAMKTKAGETKVSETNAGENQSQPNGTPRSVFQQPPAPRQTGVPARGRTVRPAANTIIPRQPQPNQSLGQRGGKGRGRGRRYRGGRG